MFSSPWAEVTELLELAKNTQVKCLGGVFDMNYRVLPETIDQFEMLKGIQGVCSVDVEEQLSHQARGLHAFMQCNPNIGDKVTYIKGQSANNSQSLLINFEENSVYVIVYSFSFQHERLVERLSSLQKEFGKVFKFVAVSKESDRETTDLQIEGVNLLMGTNQSLVYNYAEAWADNVAVIKKQKLVWVSYLEELLELSILERLKERDVSFLPNPLNLGDQCPSFEVFNVAQSKTMQFEFREDDPTVYLIHVWSLRSKKPIEINRRTLGSRSYWEDRVKVIPVLVDTNFEAVKQYKEISCDLEEFEVYWGGPKGILEGVFKSLGTSFHPRSLIVQFGKVEFVGDFYKRDCGADIDALLTRHPRGTGIQSKLSDEEFKERTEKVQQLIRNFQASRSARLMFGVYCLKYELVGKANLEQRVPTLQGEVEESCKEDFEELYWEILKLFPDTKSLVERY